MFEQGSHNKEFLTVGGISCVCTVHINDSFMLVIYVITLHLCPPSVDCNLHLLFIGCIRISSVDYVCPVILHHRNDFLLSVFQILTLSLQWRKPFPSNDTVNI